MAGRTPKFGMAYFDFGDTLNTPINVKKEIDRFVFIDKQLFGIYSIFGDGVISGWEVFDNGFSTSRGISLGIDSGIGVISAIASETLVPDFIDFVTANRTLFVYARPVGATSQDMGVEFVVSETALTDALMLATVQTGSQGVSSIDNTTRDNISFEETVLDAISEHKHRGSPSKIDLSRETKNQLDSAKILGVGAEKIGEGRFSQELIPTIDHADLLGAGLISHAGLDALAQAITSTSVPLLGEVIAVNDMKQLAFLKGKFTNIDEQLHNEVVVIPGVSPDEIIDFENSTATIDTTSKCIRGASFANADLYFYTKNFELPANVNSILITSNSSVGDDGEITFGISTTNSTDFSTFTAISENTATTVEAAGSNLRLGIRLTSPSTLVTHDPYLMAYEDVVDFLFSNDADDADFHFRIRFYEDIGLTTLHATAYSLDDQEQWVINDSEVIPSEGYPVDAGENVVVTYYPDLTEFSAGTVYYVVIDAWNGSEFVSQSSGFTFVSGGNSTCFSNTNIPIVKNVVFVFTLDDGSKVKLNV